LAIHLISSPILAIIIYFGGFSFQILHSTRHGGIEKRKTVVGNKNTSINKYF
jgi:hypothetical protein